MNYYKNLKDFLNFLNPKPSPLVFTNGCFDILHIGHIRYLKASRNLGKHLTIGLNSDKSVKILKGNKRPINNEDIRAEFLLSLTFVDSVVLFDEDTPYNLIKSIKPDILTKGGDYKISDIVGSDIVESNGGKVEVIPFVAGYSTSKIISKI